MLKLFGFGAKPEAKQIQVEAAEDTGCCGGHGHRHAHQAEVEEMAGGCCGGHGHHHAAPVQVVEEDEEDGCCGGHGQGGCGCSH